MNPEGLFSSAKAKVRSGELLAGLDAFLDLTQGRAPAAAWNDRGMVHYLLGEEELAAECFARALAQEPRHFLARANAFYLAEAGRVKAAPVPDFRAAIRFRKSWGETPPPRVSVIMGTFNRAKLIQESIESVLKQTFCDFELVIVNDGGDHELETWLEAIHEPRLRYFYAEHKGTAHAYNVGIAEARGYYLAFLADDDIYYPDHLECLVAAMESLPEPAIVHADSFQAFQRKVGSGYRTVRRELRSAGPEARERLATSNVIPPASLLFPRSFLDRVGVFRIALRKAIDWDFNLRLADAFTFQHVAKETSEFRTRDDASQLTGKLKAEKNYWDSLVLYMNRRLNLFSFPEQPSAQSAYTRALDLLQEMAGSAEDTIRFFSLRELWRMTKPHRYFTDQAAKHLAAGRRELARQMFTASLRLNPWEPKTWWGRWRAR